MNTLKKWWQDYRSFIGRIVRGHPGKITTAICIFLIVLLFLMLFGCGALDRIVSTSEKIIQGEVYYQTRRGESKIYEATAVAEEKLKKQEKKLDQKIKNLEEKIEVRQRPKFNTKNFPRPIEECKDEVTLYGVKRKCKD